MELLYLLIIYNKSKMIKPQTYFQSRVNSEKVNQDFFKPIIETDIKEPLKIIIILIYLILKMKILKMNFKRAKLKD